MKIQIFLIILLFTGNSFSQKLEKIAKLPDSMKEISGLCFLNDTVLVGHNDSGNEPILYFLNLKGQKIHQVEVLEAKNNDWEDITADGKGHLYIGDIGNNNNSRKKLRIYKVSTWNILKKKEVKKMFLVNGVFPVCFRAGGVVDVELEPFPGDCDSQDTQDDGPDDSNFENMSNDGHLQIVL